MSSCIYKKVQSYETWTVNYSCVEFVWVEGSGVSDLYYYKTRFL